VIFNIESWKIAYKNKSSENVANFKYLETRLRNENWSHEEIEGSRDSSVGVALG
jgi:hypothetical protein